MATITLRNVPDDLHRRLKEAARRNRRSLNQEAIEQLDSATSALSGNSVEDELERFRRLRAATPELRIDPAELEAAINEGRE
jgi:plasmid stability protein